MAGNVINEILYVSVSVYVFVFVCLGREEEGERVMIYSLDEGCSIFLVKMHQLTVRVMDSAELEEI